MAFSGTIQKCKACDKTVHFVEMISADGIPYHNICFRCVQCNGKLVVCILLYLFNFYYIFIISYHLFVINKLQHLICFCKPWETQNSCSIYDDKQQRNVLRIQKIVSSQGSLIRVLSDLIVIQKLCMILSIN